MKKRDQIIEILHLQRDAGAYLRYVRETNPELTVTLKMHLHDTTVGGGGGHGVNGEWKRAKKVHHTSTWFIQSIDLIIVRLCDHVRFRCFILRPGETIPCSPLFLTSNAGITTMNFS